LKTIRAAERWLTKAVEALLMCAFGLMLGLAALQVFLRFFFHSGIPWGDIAARHLVLWAGFFGAYLATRQGKHFHVDALVRLFPSRVRYGTAALTNGLAATICFFLLQASYTFMTVGIDPDASLFLGIPEKYLAAIVPIGFGLIVLQFILRTIENLISAFGADAPEKAR
jgi:TRAP-type C4-dicarboxylate transport system permease small subunit